MNTQNNVHHRKTCTRLAIGIAILGVGLGLAGCGGGSDASTAANSGGSSAPASGSSSEPASGGSSAPASVGNSDPGTSSSSSGAATGSSSSGNSGSFGTTFTPSPNDSMIPSVTHLVDSAGTGWTVSAGVIARNGTPQNVTHAVVVLVYHDAVIYQENSACNWWSWTGGTWNASARPAAANLPACSASVAGTGSDTSSSSSSGGHGGSSSSSSSGASSSSGSSSGAGSSSSSSGASHTSAGVPSEATAVGYNTQTFNSTTIGTTAGTWQKHTFEGCNTDPRAYSQNSDGSIALSGYGNTCSGANLATASQANTATDWKGLAFGGGAYFEATMSFTGQGNGPYANGGPAFWAEDVEHMSQGPYVVGWPSDSNPWNAGTSYAVNAMVSFDSQVWISNLANNLGNAPPSGTAHANAAWRLYNDFFEVDFMEYDSNEYTYQNGIGNWWGNSGGSLNGPGGGTHNTTVNSVAGQVGVPPGTDFSQPHKYGCLWVPATPSTQGYLKFYFDDVQTGQTFYWDYYDINDPSTYPAPAPVNGTTAMSGMDWRHLFLMIGTGTTQPTTVKSVGVWQASGAHNLSY